MQENQPEESLVSCYPDATGNYVMAEKGRNGDAWIRINPENLVDLLEWQ